MLKKNSIEIISPSRLHFGFLEISGNNDRSYGGIGLSIDKFSTKIIVKKSNKVKIRINCLDKASFFLNEFCRKKKIKNNYLINIKKSSPKHIGLGSGTQLALSIGCAVSKLNNLDLDIKNISKILNRSLRSNIGLMNFKTGGFLIDLDIKKKFFTPIGKVFFPEEWKIILIKNLEKGLHGNKEVNAFRKIKKFPRKKNISLTNLVLLKIYPSIIQNNFEKFSRGITELQDVMGKYFQVFQGGQFSSSEVFNVLNFLKKEKVLGYGQTSWGPSGFAFFPNLKKAQQMQSKLKEKFSRCNNLEFIICSGKNDGANIQLK